MIRMGGAWASPRASTLSCCVVVSLAASNVTLAGKCKSNTKNLLSKKSDLVSIAKMCLLCKQLKTNLSEFISADFAFEKLKALFDLFIKQFQNVKNTKHLHAYINIFPLSFFPKAKLFVDKIYYFASFGTV